MALFVILIEPSSTGKSVFSGEVLHNPMFGVRNSHRKIHIISKGAVDGLIDNPLQPIIDEVNAGSDKYELWPIEDLADAENIFKILVAANDPEQGGTRVVKGQLRDLIYIDDFASDIRNNTWFHKRLEKCRNVQQEHTDVWVVSQSLDRTTGLPPCALDCFDHIVAMARAVKFKDRIASKIELGAWKPPQKTKQQALKEKIVETAWKGVPGSEKDSNYNFFYLNMKEKQEDGTYLMMSNFDGEIKAAMPQMIKPLSAKYSEALAEARRYVCA